MITKNYNYPFTTHLHIYHNDEEIRDNYPYDFKVSDLIRFEPKPPVAMEDNQRLLIAIFVERFSV